MSPYAIYKYFVVRLERKDLFQEPHSFEKEQEAFGKIIVLETKDDHLDAEKKIKLDILWASKAGNDCRYFLVYKERVVEGAYIKARFIDNIKTNN